MLLQISSRVYDIARLVIAVTGTPGSGKSHLAKLLSNKIKDSGVLELSDIVERYKLYSSKDKYGSKIIRTKQLRDKVKKLVNGQKEVAILVGHLFPELGIRADLTVVTRVGLAKLAKRLEARGYQKGKISENLVSEALDYCGQGSRKLSDETYEVETDKEKRAVLLYITGIAKGRKVKRPLSREISKTKDIVALARGKNPYGL